MSLPPVAFGGQVLPVRNPRAEEVDGARLEAAYEELVDDEGVRMLERQQQEKRREQLRAKAELDNVKKSKEAHRA